MTALLYALTERLQSWNFQRRSRAARSDTESTLGQENVALYARGFTKLLHALTSGKFETCANQATRKSPEFTNAKYVNITDIMQ
jgi:hypothetical protein